MYDDEPQVCRVMSQESVLDVYVGDIAPNLRYCQEETQLRTAQLHEQLRNHNLVLQSKARLQSQSDRNHRLSNAAVK